MFFFLSCQNTELAANNKLLQIRKRSFPFVNGGWDNYVKRSEKRERESGVFVQFLIGEGLMYVCMYKE